MCTGTLQVRKINVFVTYILGVSSIMLHHFHYDHHLDKQGLDNRGSTVHVHMNAFLTNLSSLRLEFCH